MKKITVRIADILPTITRAISAVVVAAGRAERGAKRCLYRA
jgi:hypothetical protein